MNCEVRMAECRGLIFLGLGNERLDCMSHDRVVRF